MSSILTDEQEAERERSCRFGRRFDGDGCTVDRRAHPPAMSFTMTR